MTDVELIRRSSDTQTAKGFTVSGGGTSGAVGHAATADKATHAQSAATLDAGSDVRKALENLQGALKDTDNKFLRKDIADVAQKIITFIEGLNLGSSGDYWLHGNGEARLNILTLLSNLTVGGSIAGKSVTATTANISDKLTTKTLEVTGSAHFFELVIDKLRSIGGAYLLTPANGFEAQRVVYDSVHNTYTLYWTKSDGQNTQENQWRAGYQAICQSFNVAQGSNHDISSKLWWARVTAAGSTGNENYITVDMNNALSAEAGAKGVPAVGDAVAMLGSTALDANGNVDTRAQSAIYLTSYASIDSDLSAPCLAIYEGIDGFSLKGHRTFSISPEGLLVLADRVKFLSRDGKTYKTALDMDNELGSISATVTGQEGRINSLELTASGINLRVSNVMRGTSHNLLYDTGFYRPLWTKLSDGTYKDNVLMAYGIRHRLVMNNNNVANDANITTDWSVLHDGSASVLAGAEGLTADAYLGYRYNIPVTGGKTYTISVWVMTYDVSKVDGGVGVEMHYSKVVFARDIGSKYGSLKPTANGTWQRIVLTMQAPADAKYLECCFFVMRNGWVYFSQPQAEEGNEATDWYLNELDMMQRAGLDVRQGEITLAAATTKVVDDYGETIALFADGKIQARYIDAQTIVADGIKAQTIDCGNATFSNVNVSGKITATGGEIGGFVINPKDGTPMLQSQYLTLTPNHIIYRDTNNQTYDYIADMGSENIPLALRAKSDKHYNTALELEAESYTAGGGTEHYGKYLMPAMNEAIRANSGHFAGFRRQVLELNRSAAIICSFVGQETGNYLAMSGAVFLAISNVANMEITLPNAPEDGTEYYFIKAQSNNFKLTCSGKDSIYTHGSIVKEYSVGQYNTVRLTYYDGVWYESYMAS